MRGERPTAPTPSAVGAARGRTTVVVLLAAVLLAAVLLAAVPWSAAPAHAQVIAAGQEPVLAAMLGSGATLPGGCTFADGAIERTIVRATYRCPDGEVQIELSHPSARGAGPVRTDRFALAVVSRSPHDELLRALEARIRAAEGDFRWSMTAVGTDAGSSSVPGLPTWLVALPLAALAAAAALGAWRGRATRAPLAPLAALESLVVAAIVVAWLAPSAAPPAHMDTAVDLALARDCLASGGTACFGHAASAIGLVQGQGFTYALAAWLHVGWSMRALTIAAACVVAAATALLHWVVARRFGGVAWAASAVAACLAVSMTGYPTIWNPSWFVLPLAVAFVAILALARGGGTASAFVAGVGFALTAESHLLFGTFVAVAVAIVALTARRPTAAAGVVLASFVLTELVISPVTSLQNAMILHQWMEAHRRPVIGAAALSCLLLPLLGRARRALRDHAERRETVVVLVWLVAGAVVLGAMLPWAVSRPPQIRYYGAAFPAIAHAVGRVLAAATARVPAAAVRLVGIAVFAAVLGSRAGAADFTARGWLLDDARAIAAAAELTGVSALDIQWLVRPIPGGALGPVVAAFAGTADAPSFPARIVRAVLARPGAAPPAGWRHLRLARGDVFTSELDAWTRPADAEICPDPPNGDPCLAATRDDLGDVARNAGGLLHRVFGLRLTRSAARIADWSARGTRALLWRIPLQPTGDDATREIALPDTIGEEIVAVEGTRSTARSATHVVVHRPPPGALASITVRTPIADRFEAGVPPLPFELRDDEGAVLPSSSDPPG